MLIPAGLFKQLQNLCSSTFIVLMFALALPCIVFAQNPPQAGAATSILGGSIDATFYAGARIGEGPYQQILERSEDFQLEVVIEPVSDAVGSDGKVYVLAMAGAAAYTLLESGEWVPFDGTVAGLGGAKAITSYTASNAFTVNNLADLFIKQDVTVVNGEVQLAVFLGYDSSAIPGDLHYTESPLAITLVDSGLQRQALIPELSSPSSLTGEPTSARFFGGLSTAGSSDYNATLVGSTDEVDAVLEFMPEILHLDSAGKSFVLAIAGGTAFVRNNAGAWVTWDGQVASLLATESASYAELASYQTLNIDSVIDLVNEAGVQVVDDSVGFQVFVAYETDAAPGQLFFSGAPLQFTVTLPSARDEALAFYSDNISEQIIQAKCIVCHVEGGIARDAGMLFQRPGPASVLNNFAIIEDFVNSRSDGKDYILSKASGGDNHTGGVQLPAGGSDYNNMATLLDLLSSGVDVARQLFESNIASQVIQSRCIVCHVDGYAPTQNTGLIFIPTSPSSLDYNFNVFKNFVGTQPDARNYILTKVSGGGTPPHQGGVQLAPGSTDYNNLAGFIDALLTGSSGSVASLSAQFFKGVSLQSNQETLRRAAIMLAGRAPYPEEINAVNNGDDSTLRTTLRNLMSGDGFHQFLTNGANDRLLVRGTADGIFLDGDGNFKNFANETVNIRLAESEAGIFDSFNIFRFFLSIDRGLRESPLELIAHVVENDKPYSEILTADYMMVNPMANIAVDGTAVFINPDDQSEFQPGRMENYLINDGTIEFEYVEQVDVYRILEGGGFTIDYPHAGVLNTMAWLFRYPTTPTNRNRARARWTFQHFLDVDIEKSAQRTTNPMALADTNNPTLNNPACTVCHTTMDPVAGAYQNYNLEFAYRNEIPGTDSLDQFYKYADDTPYQEGDTWYRDMRTPGIFGENAPDADNSLQWLAQQIVKEPAFARAAVKFWWPAVIGRNPLRLPEVEEDATYDAHLMAYDAQSETVQALTDSFLASGMNARDLLVELVMSPWFRADSVDSAKLTPTQMSAHEISGLGNETLLTPERLARKTRALTGFGWLDYYRFEDDSANSGLADDLGEYYGGINSLSITKRAREMTALMQSVTMAHGIQSACPIVLKDFIFPDGQRRLFNGISHLTTPLNGEAAVRQKLVELHAVLLGQTYTPDSTEIESAFQLLKETWEARVAQGRPTNLMWSAEESCNWYADGFFLDDVPIDGEYMLMKYAPDGTPQPEYNDFAVNWVTERAQDPQHMKGAWVTVIAYLLTHYDFLYE